MIQIIGGYPGKILRYEQLSGPDIAPAGISTCCRFSQNKDYLVVAHSNTPYMTIYKRNGDIFTKLSNPATLPTNAQTCAFSPDNNYLAVGRNASPYLYIYKRSGDTFTKLNTPSTAPPTNIVGLAWSPDSVYLATVMSYNAEGIVIYKRSGDTLTKLSSPSPLPSTQYGYACAFSPDGISLAVGHGASPYVYIYKRSGDTFTKLADPVDIPSYAVRSCAFSSDGSYLALGLSASGSPRMYSRSGVVQTSTTNISGSTPHGRRSARPPLIYPGISCPASSLRSPTPRSIPCWPPDRRCWHGNEKIS